LTLRATPGGSNNKIWGLEFTFNPQRKDALGVLESFIGSFLGNIGITIIQMIIMIGCVTGSLIAAEKIGVEGARSLSSTAKNMNNNFKNRFKDWTKNRVQGYAASTMIAQQPPTYTGWRRIFNPINKINYKIGGTAGKVAERFGYAPKLEEISVKYGPEAREAKRKKIQELKAEIEQINQKIKNPEIINEQRKLLEQNIIEIENKLREEKEKIAQNYKNNINELEKELKEKINGMNQELEPLKALLEKELDLNKRQEIQKQIRDKEENYKKSMSGINKRLEEAKQRLNNIDKDAALSKINQELENAKNELNRFYEENTIEYLISQRRKKYEDISEAKPVGLFKALITKEEKKAEKIKKQVKELASLIEDSSDSNKESPSKTSSGPNKSS
ncbi:MAG: hypothetical protein N2Z85_02175, partial [Patescibacteria group bacterium]|nr:hypothetical protein [Patescibacteria group bacterium]